MTKFPKHAFEISQAQADSGFDIIIAVGGDGTCNEVVNGIMMSSRNNKVSFGVIPNGSGNDFYKMIGEFEPDIFIKSLLNRNSKKIDLISIESAEKQLYTLNIAGTGFDGLVVKYLDNIRFSLFLKGKVAYMVSILRSFITFKKLDTMVRCDEFSYNGKLLMVAVCNGKAFGHGLIISPDSKIDDGKMNVVLLGDVSFLDYLRNLSNLKKGVKVDHPNVHYFSTNSLEVQVDKGQLYTEADGEIFGNEDVKFALSPMALSLLY
tara:strand:+ start:49511 stop:50299 length:789 start_codon:yes stop_codon:yes gene_type:complete